MSAALVVLRLGWADKWPGDEAFDAWVHVILECELDKLRLAAVDDLQIVEWERLLGPEEPLPQDSHAPDPCERSRETPSRERAEERPRNRSGAGRRGGPQCPAVLSSEENP